MIILRLSGQEPTRGPLLTTNISSNVLLTLFMCEREGMRSIWGVHNVSMRCTLGEQEVYTSFPRSVHWHSCYVCSYTLRSIRKLCSWLTPFTFLWFWGLASGCHTLIQNPFTHWAILLIPGDELIIKLIESNIIHWFFSTFLTNN